MPLRGYSKDAIVVNDPQHNDVKNMMPPLNKQGAARRRIAKAGIGAAGVLWTLESKATYGHGFKCATPSAAVSAGISGDVRKSTCQGLPPYTWCKIGHFWPCSDKIKFSAIFKCQYKYANTYGRVTMLDLLEGKQFDGSGIGRELVAAYLNVLSGKIPFLTVEKLKEMWWDLQNGGFSPQPGITWNALGLSNYLSSTHY